MKKNSRTKVLCEHILKVVQDSERAKDRAYQIGLGKWSVVFGKESFIQPNGKDFTTDLELSAEESSQLFNSLRMIFTEMGYRVLPRASDALDVIKLSDSL